MTDDEKKRLADILEDLDTIEEVLPEEADNSTIHSHSVVLRPGTRKHLAIHAYTYIIMCIHTCTSICVEVV